MPGIQLTGKPSNAAAGGASFNESMLRAGVSGGDEAGSSGGPGLSASGLQSSFSYAATTVRLLGSAARSTTTALNQLQTKINSIRVPAGGGSGGGRGNGGGGNGSGGTTPNTPAGGGGRRGGGRGGSGATTSPNYRRMAGHLAGRIGSHTGIGGITGIIGEALEADPMMLPVMGLGALAMSPQIMSGAFSGFMGATSPYRNFAVSAYGMSRAGGFDGDSLISNLSDNGSATGSAMSQQLRAVGLGSTDAMSIVQQYGIGPTSADGFVGNATALAQMGLNSNLGGMDQGQLIAVQRMLTGGGIGASTATDNPGDSVRANTAAMSDFLADATSRGLDKSIMIQSMQNSLSTVAAGGGLGANMDSAIQFNRGMFDNNNLAARNGSSAANLSSSISASFNSPFASPARAMMLTQATAKIHSAGDLQRVIGQSAFQALDATGNTAGQAEIRGLLDPSTPSSVRTQLLGAIISNNQSAAISVSQDWAAGFTSNPATQASIVSSMTGANLGDAYNGIAATTMSSGQYMPGQDASYTARLREMGISATQTQVIIAAAKQNGINPLILGGQFGVESSNGLDKRAQKYTKGGYNGDFQMGDYEFHKYGTGGSVMNFSDAAYAAANYDKQLGVQSDPAAALAKYNGETDGLNTYSNNIYAKISGGQATPNTPITSAQQTLLNLGADNSNAGLNGAKATFVELKGSVDGLAQAVAALQGVVTQLASAPPENHPNRGSARSPTQKNPYTGSSK